jgi:N-acetylmuramoyl-L-alanine amidase
MEFVCLDILQEYSKILLQYISGQNNINPFECQGKLVKMLVMSAYFNVNRNHFMCLATAVLCLSFCFSGDTFGIDPLQQDAPAGIVVLDPGHGGHNTGAAGPENLLEKHVAMKFSRILADQLKNRYKVLLTRTDDYDVPFEDRLAKANHARADLLISIHAGGSMLHNIGGISIFYYEKPLVKELSSKASLPGSIAAKHLEPWGYIKPVHIERSRYFAELLKMQLLDDQKDLKITITGAPLMIAAGADMPALLIEIGYITNPGDAQSLNNKDILYSYAKSIVNAIDAFFSDKLH